MHLQAITNALKQNKVGIFPCDTIWGLIGRLNLEVIQRIADIKQRPIDKPFLFLIPSLDFVPQLAADIPQSAEKLMQQYWPGPLTIILNKHQNVSSEFTAQQPTIGLRYPNFQPLNELLDNLQEPLISTSVNLNQQEAITNIEDLPEEIKQHVDFIYTNHQPPLTQASTIVNCTTDKPFVLREGILKLEF